MTTWQKLTPDEQEALRYLRGICELEENISEAVFDGLVSKGLADVTNDDAWYGRDYMITIAGSIVLSQESEEPTS